MILAPKDTNSICRVRVKGTIYDVAKTLLSKIQDTTSAKQTINTYLADKGFKIDIDYNTKSFWLGSIDTPIPDKWWIGDI